MLTINEDQDDERVLDAAAQLTSNPINEIAMLDEIAKLLDFTEERVFESLKRLQARGDIEAFILQPPKGAAS